MRATTYNSTGALFLEGFRRHRQCPLGVTHVVDANSDAVLDFADYVHFRHYIGSDATLVDDRQRGVQSSRDRARALDSAGIRRDNRDLVIIKLLFQMLEQDRGSIDVIHWDIEKTLDLAGVKIHCKHARSACRSDQIGN